jgi:hypothetical protein
MSLSFWRRAWEVCLFDPDKTDHPIHQPTPKLHLPDTVLAFTIRTTTKMPSLSVTSSPWPRSILICFEVQRPYYCSLYRFKLTMCPEGRTRATVSRNVGVSCALRVRPYSQINAWFTLQAVLRRLRKPKACCNKASNIVHRTKKADGSREIDSWCKAPPPKPEPPVLIDDQRERHVFP